MGNQLSDEVLNEYTVESEEIIQRFSEKLRSIEGIQASAEDISSLYRDMHTLKGSSQLFGFKGIGQLAHAIEASLDPIRGGKKQLSPKIIDVIYEALNVLELGIKAIRDKNSQPSFDLAVDKMLPKLIEFISNDYSQSYNLSKSTSIKTDSAKQVIQDKKPSAEKIPQKIDDTKVTVMKDTSKNEQQKVEAIKVESPKSDLNKAENIKAETQDGGSSNPESSTIRVQVSLLDKLMNIAGELVLVRNQVLQYSQKSDNYEFLNLSQRLDVVTSDLQAEVMKTRMQPIGSVLTKFQRVVRDLAKDLNKKIELDLFGAETEVDKTLLEAIKDPLTHIVRNACDHGIETPAERKAAGKNEVGHIKIQAGHEGGQVIIEIIDDGKGLNAAKLIAKATEKNIISPERAQTMSEKEAFNLIFAPGFSTASQVTSVSGRGVGMDVVKTNIEKVGGAVEINSTLNKGMNLKLKIPLTLAIVPAMTVRNQNQTFAIPQVKLNELVRVEKDSTQEKIEFLQDRPMYRLRGDLLPLISLNQVLGLTDGSGDFKSDSTNIVVLNNEQDSFGLVVEEINDTADIVVKPLAQSLKNLGVFSGATIMGDGGLALILDVAGVAAKGSIVNHRNKENYTEKLASTHNVDSQEFLFFNLSTQGKYGVPLCLVQRLEEFSVEQVEFSGEQRVVQYRDSILPLLSLNKFLGFSDNYESNVLSVIVVQKRSKSFGVIVNNILDIVRIDGQIQEPLKNKSGVMGNVISDDEIISVIDVLAVIDAFADFKDQKTGSATKKIVAKGSRGKILYAEDTIFFQKHVRKILEQEGYEVVIFENGELAYQYFESPEGQNIRMILSDIEMPILDGNGFAEKVRKNSKNSKIPMIAVTTRFKDSDIEKGVKAGFNQYLEKLKADELIEAINRTLGEN